MWTGKVFNSISVAQHMAVRLARGRLAFLPLRFGLVCQVGEDAIK
jgi:hypothetical protein